jgi:hypothetical protein
VPDNPAHQKAARLARTIAADIALYNPELVEKGVREGNFFKLLAKDIEDGRKHYESKVGPEIMALSDYFQLALEDLIAKKKKKLGLNPKIISTTWTDMCQRQQKPETAFHFAIITHVASVPHPSEFLNYYTKEGWGVPYPPGGMYYYNPKVTEAIEKGNNSLDLEEQNKRRQKGNGSRVQKAAVPSVQERVSLWGKRKEKWRKKTGKRKTPPKMIRTPSRAMSGSWLLIMISSPASQPTKERIKESKNPVGECPWDCQRTRPGRGSGLWPGPTLPAENRYSSISPGTAHPFPFISAILLQLSRFRHPSPGRAAPG